MSSVNGDTRCCRVLVATFLALHVTINWAALLQSTTFILVKSKRIISRRYLKAEAMSNKDPMEDRLTHL